MICMSKWVVADLTNEMKCGRIPEYDVWSKTGELKTEVFFYKKILSLHAIGKESRDQSENEAVRDLN